jgi:hypothetical protein
LPPLTVAHFEDACGHNHRGIAIVDTEDGDVFTFGHVDLDEFASAVNEHEAELIGHMDEDDQIHTADVAHLWAVTVQPDDHPEGWLINWGKNVSEQAPGAFPMTVATR